jgi:hypothetical protein
VKLLSFNAYDIAVLDRDIPGLPVTTSPDAFDAMLEQPRSTRRRTAEIRRRRAAIRSQRLPRTAHPLAITQTLLESASTARCCFRSRVRAMFDAVRLRDGRRAR